MGCLRHTFAKIFALACVCIPDHKLLLSLVLLLLGAKLRQLIDVYGGSPFDNDIDVLQGGLLTGVENQVFEATSLVLQRCQHFVLFQET